MIIEPGQLWEDNTTKQNFIVVELEDNVVRIRVKGTYNDTVERINQLQTRYHLVN